MSTADKKASKKPAAAPDPTSAAPAPEVGTGGAPEAETETSEVEAGGATEVEAVSSDPRERFRAALEAKNSRPGSHPGSQASDGTVMHSSNGKRQRQFRRKSG